MGLTWLALLAALGIASIILYIIKKTRGTVEQSNNDRVFIFIVRDGAEWIEGLARSLCNTMFLEYYGPFMVILADNYSDDETHAIMTRLARELEVVQCVPVAQALQCLTALDEGREVYYFELEKQTNFLKLVNGLRMVLEGSKSFDDVSAALMNKNGGVIACWAERAVKQEM